MPAPLRRCGKRLPTCRLIGGYEEITKHPRKSRGQRINRSRWNVRWGEQAMSWNVTWHTNTEQVDRRLLWVVVAFGAAAIWGGGYWLTQGEIAIRHSEADRRSRVT